MLSVIIPALNEEKYLPRLLADLSRQIYRDFEVIVVDGGSTDKTVALAKNWRRKLPALRLVVSPRAHVCIQRNLGAKLAKNNILVFIDADCRIGPEFLLGLRYRWEQAQADVLSFWLKPDEVNPQNEALALAINLFRELQNNLKPQFLLEALFAVDREAFFSAGGFDETVNHSEGSFLIKQLMKKGYISKIVRDPLFCFSFRRLRQKGLLKMAGAIAALELSRLVGKDYRNLVAKKVYPMVGGSQFERRKQKKQRFVDKISELWDKISPGF